MKVVRLSGLRTGHLYPRGDTRGAHFFQALSRLSPLPPPTLSRRHHCFKIVVGLVWSNDQEICAGSSITIGRACHAKQVKGDDPNKKGHSGPPGGGSVWSCQPTPLKIYCFEALRKKETGWRTSVKEAKVHERLQCQKKSRFLDHDYIGNRTRDLSTCSAMPHRVPLTVAQRHNKSKSLVTWTEVFCR
jgi:hypothetical protein